MNLVIIHSSQPYFGWVALIQSKNHAANKGKTAGGDQFDTHPTRIGSKVYCKVDRLLTGLTAQQKGTTMLFN